MSERDGVLQFLDAFLGGVQREHRHGRQPVPVRAEVPLLAGHEQPAHERVVKQPLPAVVGDEADERRPYLDQVPVAVDHGMPDLLTELVPEQRLSHEFATDSGELPGDRAHCGSVGTGCR
jgi:hypothetical protein